MADPAPKNLKLTGAGSLSAASGPGALAAAEGLSARPGAWVEVGLTLPIFLAYHLGVVFLNIQNATDFVTRGLVWAADGDKLRYFGITLAIGAIFTGFFAVAGRGQAFVPRKFLQIALEGITYAVIMRVVAAYVVGRLFAGQIQEDGRFTGLIMSCGAGFYEELAFRVGLFGLGAKLILWLTSKEKIGLVGPGKVFRSAKHALFIGAWALACAMVFSGIHYVGGMSDNFQLNSFLFRALLGLALTLIFVTRGFAAAVWTHTVYDVWVLVFH